jgi:hypothetical protein
MKKQYTPGQIEQGAREKRIEAQVGHKCGHVPENYVRHFCEAIDKSPNPEVTKALIDLWHSITKGAKNAA